MRRLTVRDSDGMAHATKVGYYDIINKLAHYEDLEEQGKLLELPYVLGQTIYWITTVCKAGIEPEGSCYVYDCEACPYNHTLTIVEGIVKSYHIMKFFEGTLEREYFITKEEAEKKLEEMKKSHGQS